MTPERWRRIDELFDAAIQVEPSDRKRWLRAQTCHDSELLREVERLLAQHERSEEEGFLTPPEALAGSIDQTKSWEFPGYHLPGRNSEALSRARAVSEFDPKGFSPKAAIAQVSPEHPSSETAPLMRERLMHLPLIYIYILGMATFYRVVILTNEDSIIYIYDLGLTVLLMSVMALLWSPWPLSVARLRALDLAMVAMFAGRDAVVQYRLVLLFSNNGDPAMAQLTVKNLVLLTCVLILIYGLYVPKTWRQAAVVTVPLAFLPFATLVALYALHPDAMHWVARGWRQSTTSRTLLFTFDLMTLLIVAVGSAFGARAISHLRRQVALARQLGQYRLRHRIGAGGMGEVYLAEHQLLKRPCALKLIRHGAAVEPKALARFEREVQLTATLSHPNTIEIFDYGRTEDGSYYYVMEYLPGLSLSELVQAHGPLAPARAVYLLRQVCLALREAHAAGLIHRDIKPSNIFAARRGGMDDVAKLLDFGLVRPVAKVTAAELSDEGQILGTPLFMSPEQATGSHELDERSDIYSLGAVAYYLLTGRPPFDADGAVAAMIAHARDSVVPPSQLQIGIPEDLERVVLRCLLKEPADRFPDAASLERELRECACVSDWDQDRATSWWQHSGQVLATTA
jgi:eukaryotic-like serine/threonine-protein kinase